MGLEFYKKNLKEIDIYIKVDVEGYFVVSFIFSVVDILICWGEEVVLV